MNADKKVSQSSVAKVNLSFTHTVRSELTKVNPSFSYYVHKVTSHKNFGINASLMLTLIAAFPMMKYAAEMGRQISHLDQDNIIASIILFLFSVAACIASRKEQIPLFPQANLGAAIYYLLAITAPLFIGFTDTINLWRMLICHFIGPVYAFLFCFIIFLKIINYSKQK